ncbi:hypothetical protein Cs7R123_51570 [Catellatospora sp. TT07R-123]|uniref:hypothetical protein n=1 Tax=Catellatospora sp. TT07R-123 TaxID=2733863 RepID=UPI001B27E8D4|nr:hypothetical protein [Catellatospora sp. TT07R-123]GHJ47815.1 hypothetical protein Cs7R123_51570 [Catellatospora sp. TT07R-123]
MKHADALPRGKTFADLAAFLRTTDGYPTHEVRECVCACAAREFAVAVQSDEQAVRRTCLACGEDAFIADSGEHWDAGAEPEYFGCPCGGERFTAAVGFSLHDDGDVRWLTLGLRCLDCDSMGVYEDWKIDYGPSGHLLDQV